MSLHWTLSQQALADCRDLFPDYDPRTIRERVATFVDRAALTTHPLGNRRFGQYVMEVRGPVVKRVGWYDRSEPPCFDCHGLRYHFQRDGDKFVRVNCQACINK